MLTRRVRIVAPYFLATELVNSGSVVPNAKNWMHVAYFVCDVCSEE